MPLYELGVIIDPEASPEEETAIIERLNQGCEQWSFEVYEHSVHDDEVVVLEDGEIIGRGTHDELIETCPTYAEIVESQIGQGAVA